ncbi:hypothetical protein DH2020_013761 [Rehmannia glutinosa]|uniref:Nuclear condensin complex subunit 3 C-terminal domain-containing protein n=1 Tax=Rehmannia glutinosa TaxID=99300 RepID=A0ABR0X6A5_REHGL
MATGESEEHRKLSLKIAGIFDDVRTSHATHIRKLKELAALRSSSPTEFCSAFCQALTALFNFQRRTAAAERIIKFASVFACSYGRKGDCSDEFLGNFLKFLLVAAVAANKTARFRACQIVSEIIMRLPDDAEVSNELWDEVIECMMLRVGDKIIMRLPDDAEVSNELWDEVIECMMLRVGDKVSAVRVYAVRALARFANDSENSDILKLFLEKLQLEQNGEVRKTIVLSLPPSSETLSMIIDCTLDVSESVRKAAYCVLASKFPLQSLRSADNHFKIQASLIHSSHKHQAQNNYSSEGLTDRSAAVTKECLRMMKDEWLDKCCSGDPIELLKFLDVETYELVGESVMATLLKAGLVRSIFSNFCKMIVKFMQLFAKAMVSEIFGHCNNSIELMDPEAALFWRMVSVFAEEASDNNDLLDRILPASISEYVELVNAHIAAGPNYRFVSRQLLLLGAMLDFSDASNRKVASEFVQSLFHKALDHELDDNGNEVVIGDGFNLGGERDWAAAVAELAKKVHAATGEFEEVVLRVIEELARPCRERTADCKQWLHCLALIALLLENTSSFRHMQGRAIDPVEILHSLLLPGAKHSNLDVQRASIRCLGLFGLLERKPSENIVKQLRVSFVKGPPTIAIMAAKALLDLGIWHGPDEMDKAMNCNLSSQLRDHKMLLTPVEFCNGTEDLDIEFLDLLYAGLEHDWGDFVEVDENQSVQGILGEGLAKILLLSNKFPGLHSPTYHLLLAKLISLYFSSENEELQRLKQCLSVFFEHYPSLSADHKKCISKAFVPVIRSLWPGVNGNVVGSTVMVSNMRKRAVQASRFMLQMMQVPLFVKETTKPDDNRSENPDVDTDPSPDFESGEEGLAIRIALENTCLASISVSEQGAIKLMRRILNRVMVSVAAEKDLTKELRQMAERLKAIDRHPDETLSPEQTNLILEMLELSINLDDDEGDCMEVAPTPAPQSMRRNRARRRTRKEEESSSEDEISPTSVVPSAVANSRSQRASKTAAMTRMTAKTTIRIDEDDDADTEDDENAAGSEVTSEDDSESFE